MPWKDEREPTIKYCLGGHVNVVQKFITTQSFEHNWWWASGIRVEYFPRIHHIAALQQSPRVPVRNEREARIIQRTDHLHVDVQRHLMVISRQWTGMRIKRPTRFDLCEKIFTMKMVIPRTWIRKEVVFYLQWKTTRRMGQSRGIDDDKIQWKRTPSLPIHESIIQRSAQKQRWWKIVKTLLRWWGNDWNCFSHNISVNQLSIYGAVSDLCEDYKACHVRTGRRILARQSDPLFEPASLLTKTPTLSTDDPAQEDLLQKYQERAERLSQQKRVIKICTDAGFLTTVEVGQYFMTKHTDEFLQFTEPVTCREYTLPRDEKSSDPKGWIRENTKNESVDKDYSHSWVRISHGLKKLVTDLIDKEYDDNEQETSETKSEEFALKTNVLAFASRSKAKAKPRRSTSACSSARTVPTCERCGTYSNIAYPVSKRLTTLLRHGPLPREEDGAIEFWRLKNYLRNEFENSQHWSDEMWKSKMAGGGGNKEKNSILYWLVRTRNSLSPSSSRSFRTQSHWSFTTGQCVNSGHFLRVYLSYWMCSQFTLHHKFRIGNGRTKFRQGKTDSILYGCESHEQGTQRSGCNWLGCTASCLVQAEIVEETSRHCVLGWYSSIKQDRTQSSFTTHSQLIVSRKLLWWNLEKSQNGKLNVSPRPPPKISFKDNWMEELGSEVAGGGEDSEQTQPKTPNPIIKNGETRGWATVHPEDRKRCLVWSRRHQKLILQKSENQRWSMKQGRRAQKFTDGHLSFEECRIGDRAPKIQRSSCTPRRHCERWSWFLCSIYRTRIINDSSKSHGYHIQTATMLGTSSGRKQYLLTPSKDGRCSQIIKNSQIGMSRHLDSSTTTQMASIMSSMEDPVVPLERNLYGHPLAALLWERLFGKIILKYGWEKVSNWECWFVHREKGLFLSVYVDDIKLAGKKQNIDPMWKVLNKEVDLGEPSSFLDHVNLGCTQRQCEISKDIVDNYRTMFESRISAGATEKLPCSENPCISSWSYDMEDHATKRVERYCELANRTTQQIYKVSTPWPSFQRRRLEIRGRMVKSMLSNCYEMIILGTYWKTWYSMVSEQTCTIHHKMDKSLWQTIMSFDLLHSSYMWIQTVLPCGKHCQTMRTGTLQEILRIQNLHQVDHCAFLEVIRLFQSVGCVRIKLQFRTESEIISLDAGLRLDGIPALDLWDLIVAVLHGNTYQSNQARWDFCTNQREIRAVHDTLQKRKKSHGMIDDLDNVDFISSNVNSSRQEALLYVFEDNEAVIKMIIKGRSPTMRHVSRTHRVALDWLFDRINLDTKIQI